MNKEDKKHELESDENRATLISTYFALDRPTVFPQS